MNMLKERINGTLLYRYPVIEIYSIIMNFYIHIKYSFKPNGPLNNKESFVFYLTKSYHIVEKGLSLPYPRKFFGKDKISKLMYFTRKYIEIYGFDYHVENINSALSDYVSYHNRFNDSSENPLIIEIKKYLHDENRKPINGNGGIETIVDNVDNIISFEQYNKFISSRRSVRSFSKKQVLESDIRNVVNLSIKTPSVCNRQGWGVYAYFRREEIDNLLKYQNGNAGFGEEVNCLLVVVGKSKAFSRFEYNQLYIDGGMFSMSIVNSLHALGLGSCPLNLCMPYSREVKLKKLANIKTDERLVMMIAVGHKKNEYIVAKSPRMNAESVLTINN
ncbi:nitroreductase family protein [Vibrio parahaemolyticus]|nr:nitroreductase family protein [Vibrio parahaemolyticus]